ncbi:MAG: LysR substrate-binding domain-containing protein, partial [Alphaproteobacteria bacterium]
LPGEDVAHRGALLQWFETRRVQPSIVAELDDSALMKAFGQGGAGAFAAPTMIADHVCRQYGVEAVGEIAEVNTQVYAITTERRLAHPAMQAIR